MEIPAYTIIDEGTDLLWAQFQQIVKELNWTTDDNTSEFSLANSQMNIHLSPRPPSESFHDAMCLRWEEWRWVYNS